MSGKMLAEALVEAISEVQFNVNIKKLKMMLVIILALQ
jgi:hypothetical protein